MGRIIIRMWKRECPQIKWCFYSGVQLVVNQVCVAASELAVIVTSRNTQTHVWMFDKNVQMQCPFHRVPKHSKFIS
jgi:hypothetical protein